MFDTIAKLFERMGSDHRDAEIQTAGVVGILGNLLLAGVKFFIGFTSGSVAIMSDAVHNFTDSGNSALALASARFAEKAPTAKHPHGYGRVEYIAGMLIAAIIIFLGIEFFRESWASIFDPQDVEFQALDLVLLVMAILVKIAMAFYTRSVAARHNAPALRATAVEAFTDVFKSGVALVSAFILYFTGLPIDGYAGLVISLFIMYAGFTIIRETFDGIVGSNADAVLATHIYEDVSKTRYVKGVHDLILHNYGPNRYKGSVYVELEDDVAVGEFAPYLKEAQDHILAEHGIFLVFGIYPINTASDRVECMRGVIAGILEDFEHAREPHAIYVDDRERTISFDIIVDFTVSDVGSISDAVAKRVSDRFDGYEVRVDVERPYV